MATTTYGTPYVDGTDLVANWPAASLTVADSIDEAGYFVGRGISAQTASYTGVLTDAGKTITMTAAGANTVTIPANSSVAYVTGTRINILNLGAGACTPTAGAGVTINGTISALATNGAACVIKTDTNTWSFYQISASNSAGLDLITPTSVAGSGVTLSGGAVSFSGSTSVSVNGCFTSTYANYRIIISGVCNAFSALDARLRLAGTDSTTSYTSQTLRASATTVSAATGITNGANVAAINTLQSIVVIDLAGPALAQATAIYATSGVNSRIDQCAGAHSPATAHDGITFVPDLAIGTRTLTGTLRVYGLRNS